MIVLVGFFPNKEKKETYDTTELFSFAKITDECDRIFKKNHFDCVFFYQKDLQRLCIRIFGREIP